MAESGGEAAATAPDGDMGLYCAGLSGGLMGSCNALLLAGSTAESAPDVGVIMGIGVFGVSGVGSECCGYQGWCTCCCRTAGEAAREADLFLPGELDEESD